MTATQILEMAVQIYVNKNQVTHVLALLSLLVFQTVEMEFENLLSNVMITILQVMMVAAQPVSWKIIGLVTQLVIQPHVLLIAEMES